MKITKLTQTTTTRRYTRDEFERALGLKEPLVSVEWIASPPGVEVVTQSSRFEGEAE